MLILVTVIGIGGGLIFASIAYTHFREVTGEHRPWFFLSAAFLFIGLLSAVAALITNPGLFGPQVEGETITNKKETAPTVPIAQGSGSTPAPAPKPVTMAEKHQAGSFSGSGSGQTPVFHIKGKQWSIFWDITQTKTPAEFSFFVWSKGAGQPLPADSLIPGSEKETRIFQPGDFYIKVKGSNVKWKFSVVDTYSEAGEAETPTTSASP